VELSDVQHKGTTMNLSEFKAWFEGFTDGLEAAPSEKQWGRIKEKIKLIKDAPPTERIVFVDHWARPWRRWWEGPHLYDAPAGRPIKRVIVEKPVWQSMQSFSRGRSSSGQEPPVRSMIQREADFIAEAFDSSAAFRDLGRAEARSMRG
jgi:hypothetical protein